MCELVQEAYTVDQINSLFLSSEICAFREGQDSSNVLSRTKYPCCISDSFCQVPDAVAAVIYSKQSNM